ncbi:MAG: LytTR family transcriptional regulator [Bacteroidetes bacterium]|nr:LytTR family transcriptional regulator [Bacteroidota bacterium]
MQSGRRKLYIILFWIVITLMILYDRRFLIQKIGLGHFAECTVVRVGLLMALAYLNLNVLMSRWLEQGKWLTYGLLLSISVTAYLFVQQAYDVYLYGFVLGGGDYTFKGVSSYLAVTTLWYLILMVVFYKALEWYEQKQHIDKLEQEIKELKDKEASLEHEEGSAEIFVKSGTRQVRVNLNDILYVQGLKDYAILFLANEKLIVKGTLKNVEDLFSEGQMVRVHKSYLVAKKKVSAVGARKIMVSGLEIPVGRMYKDNVGKLIEVKG